MWDKHFGRCGNTEKSFHNGLPRRNPFTTLKLLTSTSSFEGLVTFLRERALSASLLPCSTFLKKRSWKSSKQESDLVENGMKRYDSKEWSRFGISSRSEKIVFIFCHDEMTFLYLFYAALYLSQSNMSFVELDMFPCDHVRHSGTLKKQLSFVRLLPFLLSYVQMFEISLWLKLCEWPRACLHLTS